MIGALWLLLCSPLQAQERGEEALERHATRFHFLCQKYEADFYYYEILEISRKFLMVSVTRFVRASGGAAQGRPTVAFRHRASRAKRGATPGFGWPAWLACQ